MFRIPVYTQEITLIAGGAAEPVFKDRAAGVLATDRQTNETMYQLHLTAFVPGDPRPQVWPVKVAGQPPVIHQGQQVEVLGLVASDWEQDGEGGRKGRHGVSFRAASVQPVGAKAPAPAKAS